MRARDDRIPERWFEGGGQVELLPRKDYDANRLVQSHLQLSAGTVVLLDETSGLHPPSSVATATAASRRTNSFDPERMLDEAAKLRLATLRESPRRRSSATTSSSTDKAQD